MNTSANLEKATGRANPLSVGGGVLPARIATDFQLHPRAPGQMYFATDATAGQNLYLCTATGVWSLGTGGSVGFAIYSSMYNGGSEHPQAENCLKGILMPYTALATAAPSQQLAIAAVPGLWSPRIVQVEETSTFAVRVSGVTLQ